jgi:hypothetical protein
MSICAPTRVVDDPFSIGAKKFRSLQYYSGRFRESGLANTIITFINMAASNVLQAIFASVLLVFSQ